MNQITFEQIVDKITSVEIPKFDLVVGIAQGGIVPASLLSYKLGCDLKIITLNYRDSQNNIIYSEPKLMKPLEMPEAVRSILLVDDVSVSGKTLGFAKQMLSNYRVTTFALKGKADYTLFNDISGCVNWPWRKLIS